MKKTALTTVAALCGILGTFAHAAVKTETIEYKEDDTVLEGFLAYDDAIKGPRPAILIVHDWMGVAEYSKMRTEQLAGEGYVAFCADVYGKGVRPADPGEASGLAGKYKGDRALLRKRVSAGLDVLKKHELTKKDSIAAIGYCFGGTAVLELARSGADVAGVISFHGGLDSPKPEDGKNIKARVLALHGADDPFVKPADLQAFQDEMRNAKVDWQLVSYGGAVHSFTQKKAGNDNSKGAAYNEKADRRSWQDMKQFFAELFEKK
ncbi:MAG: dienelactone hydrolase family protein [Chthoniobacteraceae bacterium]